MSSKFYDPTSIIQVIGSIYNNPQLLDFTDKYNIVDEDFPDQFHRIIFGAIYKIYELGAKKISLENISDFLSSRSKSEAIYKQQRGEEWLLKASESALPSAFDYYYGRLKKFTLLRAYANTCGSALLEDIYDPDNLLDVKKKQLQEDYLDNSTLEQIADKINGKIEDIRIKYVDGNYDEASQVAEGLEELIASFEKEPEMGVPLYGSLINTVTRGARLKKFYLRSAPSGLGKTRALVADACNFACNRIYHPDFGWISNGTQEPTLFIATEQDLTEIQTLALAFIANINEEHILLGQYEDDEKDRLDEAIKILRNSPLYIEQIPDFSLQDIENKIKKNIREHDVRYIAFDYIFSSMKILSEITQRSGGVKIREDNILFMLSTRLKDLCNIYGVFIISSTQLSGDWRESDTPDQSLLRGSKAIADKIDMGSIMLPVNQKDLAALETILGTSGFETPKIKISVYKNRRGRYNAIYLWCKADLGTCRINPMFATSWNYEVIPINDIQIQVEEHSAF